MAQVRWTPIAEADLDAILYYIAVVDRRPETGERIYFELKRCIEEQAAKQYPTLRLSSSPEGWFYVKHKRWLVFYQPSDDGVEVMRVVDAVKDLPKELLLLRS